MQKTRKRWTFIYSFIHSLEFASLAQTRRRPFDDPQDLNECSWVIQWSGYSFDENINIALEKYTEKSVFLERATCNDIVHLNAHFRQNIIIWVSNNICNIQHPFMTSFQCETRDYQRKNKFIYWIHYGLSNSIGRIMKCWAYLFNHEQLKSLRELNEWLS